MDTNTITDLNQSFTTSIYLNQSSSSTVGSSNGLGGAGNCTGGKYPATIIIQVMCCADQNSWKIGAVKLGHSEEKSSSDNLTLLSKIKFLLRMSQLYMLCNLNDGFAQRIYLRKNTWD